jgi:hypothetical protein
MDVYEGAMVLMMVHDREVWAKVVWTDGRYFDAEPTSGVFAGTSIVGSVENDVINVED